jgi:hypothetical protein
MGAEGADAVFSWTVGISSRLDREPQPHIVTTISMKARLYEAIFGGR